MDGSYYKINVFLLTIFKIAFKFWNHVRRTILCYLYCLSSQSIMCILNTHNNNIFNILHSYSIQAVPYLSPAPASTPPLQTEHILIKACQSRPNEYIHSNVFIFQRWTWLKNCPSWYLFKDYLSCWFKESSCILFYCC